MRRAKATCGVGPDVLAVFATLVLGGCSGTTVDRGPSPAAHQMTTIRDIDDLHHNLGREVVLEGDVPKRRKGFPTMALDSGLVVDVRTDEGVREADLWGRHVTVRGVVEARKTPAPSDAEGPDPTTEFPMQSDYHPPTDSEGRPFLVVRVSRILDRR
jgi:hypothetical protein